MYYLLLCIRQSFVYHSILLHIFLYYTKMCIFIHLILCKFSWLKQQLLQNICHQILLLCIWQIQPLCSTQNNEFVLKYYGINFWNWRWHEHPKSILMLGLFDPMNPKRERASQSTRNPAQISDPNPLDLELYSPWTHGRVDPVQESSYLLFPLIVFPS